MVSSPRLAGDWLSLAKTCLLSPSSPLRVIQINVRRDNPIYFLNIVQSTGLDLGQISRFQPAGNPRAASLIKVESDNFAAITSSAPLPPQAEWTDRGIIGGPPCSRGSTRGSIATSSYLVFFLSGDSP